ncbi:MAG TPA: PTS sugar transporter subunit IIA [Candidatus Olsenella pullistercoris]|uniref:PTS sugar transporter subunit IIA n=1 Tax=Candidatus Olsenella pullistercoris TaxID=2838712 RepID=A0A9D2JES6_9ACTN|nr:PTS sugar transporter subunit IIA [Candidatus Olsenella pullistercoris]
MVGQVATTREEMLRLIAQRAVEVGVAADAEAVLSALLAREELGETGMTDGFAVPHAKSAAIAEAAVLVVKNDRPVEWPSFDDKPVDIAVALLVPEADASDVHMRLLSRTAVLLMRDEFKRLVRDTDDPRAIADAINEGLDEGLDLATE